MTQHDEQASQGSLALPASPHDDVHRNTPEVLVTDNRGLPIREIRYHRHPDDLQQTDTRITRHRYDARGFRAQSSDPRLGAAGRMNFTWLNDLDGRPLRTHGVDSGIVYHFTDAAGRPRLAVTDVTEDENDAQRREQAVTRRWLYEPAGRAGRLLGIVEQVAGQSPRCLERLVYGGTGADELACNLAGQVSQHYDTAGLLQTHGYHLAGGAQRVTRRLLVGADDPQVSADWQGEEAAQWQAALQPPAEGHTSTTLVDATGAVLASTDAAGNVQHHTYDVAGRPNGSWLTLKGGRRQVILKQLDYSAAGLKLQAVHGNGVVTRYRYEPRTQRLAGMRTERPRGHALGAKLLQDLHYAYDPVGNLLKVRDEAQPVRYWRNQQIEPESRYRYDSLYQLASASGREMANAGRQSQRLPARGGLDSVAQSAYTRTYRYDRGGNLTRIRHSAPASGNNYTLDITVSDCSNRGVSNALASDPAQVDGLFTLGGEQIALAPGQALQWTPRGELQSVSPVQREVGVDDCESYRYDIGNQRILKVSVQQHAGSVERQRVLYLPGLELRSTHNGAQLAEALQVVTLSVDGAAGVRALHWAVGKPAEIGNDPLRYTYDDHLGSACLEVDGEGAVISQECYYPFGGTAAWSARSEAHGRYKTHRYSGKERDATGLYYYGFRYYQPWTGRWLSADPAGTVDGLNVYAMVRNNPMVLVDDDGLMFRWVQSTLGLGDSQEASVQPDAQGTEPTASPAASPPPSPSPSRVSNSLGEPAQPSQPDIPAQDSTAKKKKKSSGQRKREKDATTKATEQIRSQQKPVETSAQREARQSAEAVALNGTWGLPGSDVYKQLKRQRGSLPADLVAVGQKSSAEGIGAVVYLTEGYDNGGHKGEGYKHILAEHKDDFAKAGLAEEKIVPLVMTALVAGKVVGINSAAAVNRPVYEVNFEKQTRRVTIQQKGNSVLSAHPFTKARPFPMPKFRN